MKNSASNRFGIGFIVIFEYYLRNIWFSFRRRFTVKIRITCYKKTEKSNTVARITLSRIARNTQYIYIICT